MLDVLIVFLHIQISKYVKTVVLKVIDGSCWIMTAGGIPKEILCKNEFKEYILI
jgi:hypothetical protein